MTSQVYAGPEQGDWRQTFSVMQHPPHATAQPASRDASSTARSRVLVLEDSDDFAEILSAWLAMRGFEVSLACDGAAALRAMRDRQFDTMLIDIDLPDMTGFDVIARAHGAGWIRGARVIFCSGNCDPARVPETLAPQFREFLPKPFPLEELTRLIGRPS